MPLVSGVCRAASAPMLSHGGSRLNASKPEANPKTSCPFYSDKKSFRPRRAGGVHVAIRDALSLFASCFGSVSLLSRGSSPNCQKRVLRCRSPPWEQPPCAFSACIACNSACAHLHRTFLPSCVFLLSQRAARRAHAPSHPHPAFKKRESAPRARLPRVIETFCTSQFKSNRLSNKRGLPAASSARSMTQIHENFLQRRSLECVVVHGAEGIVMIGGVPGRWKWMGDGEGGQIGLPWLALGR